MKASSKFLRLALAAAATALVAAAAWVATRPSPAVAAFGISSPGALSAPYASGEITPEILQSDFEVFGGQWTAEKGRLVGKFFQDDLEAADYMDGDRPTSNPLALIWFKKPLPPEFEVSWKARSLKNAGDLNAYFCGDGGDFSGYDLVFGGWENTRSRLMRVPPGGNLDDRIFLDKIKPDSLRIGAEYEFRVRRTSGGIEVYRNGARVMGHREKEAPLVGPGFDRFGFSTWNNKVEFWDLKIEPLGQPQAP